MLTLAMSLGFISTTHAQTDVNIGTQVTQESAITDGEKYIVQSMASGKPYIVDAGTYYFLPNAGNTPTTACVYRFISNGDGTWTLKSEHTGKCWGAPTYDKAIEPVSPPEAGHWKLNFQNGIAYPTCRDAQGVERGLDRSSQKLWGYTTGTGITKQIKIFELGEAPLSEQPLSELEDLVVSVSETCAADLVTGQWYVMYDRGFTSGNPHGYLYEQVSSHTLYNTATEPTGMATKAARYLVRLSDAGDGKYYVQDGFGNFFSSFTKSTAVPVTATPKEAITIAKINGTDGHFYLQSSSTGYIMDANDVGRGDATVVGWGTTPPTSTGGNNDWAFYPVELEQLSPDVALLEDAVTVTRGYQATGLGNADALLLRIDLSARKSMTDMTFNIALSAAAQASIAELYIYESTATEFIADIPDKAVGRTADINASTALNIGSVAEGSHRYWLCATIREDAPLGTILSPAITSIGYTTGKEMTLDMSATGNPERQGMKVFAQQNFVFKPNTDNCRYYRIPAMILDEDDNIVIAADKRYNSNSDLGNHKIDVVSLRSEDGGRTWQDFATIAVGDGSTAAYFGYGDAALARATNGDLVCIMASGSKMWGYGMVTAGFARSTDNGKSWTLIKNLLDSPAFYDENSNDGSLSVTNIFTTSGKGLTTTDGVIMFTTNCKNELGTVNYILYSTDNGSHWRLSNAVAYTGTDESKLEQRNDGSLLLSVRQSGNRGWNTATYTKNADGTVTFHWGTQTRTGDIWGNACNADILYYSRQSDTDPDILLHSYINTSGRQSLQISMSLNGGTTWKDVYNIQPNGSCYSTMIQLPSGDVALLFEDESYSAGNGYAINFVTITREQILDWFVKAGGRLPVGIGLTPMDEAESSKFNDQSSKFKVQSSKFYNLAGQQLSKPQKGVNIINGKKVVVK